MARPVLLLLCGVAAAIAIAATVDHLREPWVPPPPPSFAEAAQLLSRTAEFAKAGDLTGLCEAVAAAEPNCKAMLQTAGTPGREAPSIIGSRVASDQTMVLEVAGTRADGTPYTADFAVIRNRSGEVASMTAVYWSGVVFVDPNPVP